MSADTQAWLGDLARCIARLTPRNEVTAVAMARMLGLALTADESRAGADVAPQPPAPPPVDAGSQPENIGGRDAAGLDEAASSSSGLAGETTGRPEISGASSALTDLERLPLLQRAPSRGRTRPLPWRVAEPLPPVGDRHLYSRLRHEPLLQPRWSREVLSAAIASEVADGLLDELAAVDTAARGRALERLPQLMRWSLVRGVQLLVDEGPGMEPFRRDALEVGGALRRVVGRSGVTEQRFESSLAHGVSDVWLGPKRPYAAPEPGTPVLVVSDLGIHPAGSSHHDEWLGFARRLAQRGSPCVALVPYGRRHWPAELTRRIVLIQWDRVTTVSAVRTSRRAYGNAA